MKLILFLGGRRNCNYPNMAKSKGQKFYAVAVGRNPGVYLTWDECQKQVSYDQVSRCMRQIQKATNLVFFKL